MISAKAVTVGGEVSLLLVGVIAVSAALAVIAGFMLARQRKPLPPEELKSKRK